jgi:hypothetical protein
LKDIAKSMAFAFLAAELFAKKSKSEWYYHYYTNNSILRILLL